MRKLLVVLVLVLSACVLPTDSPDVAVEVHVVCTIRDDLIDRCVES